MILKRRYALDGWDGRFGFEPTACHSEQFTVQYSKTFTEESPVLRHLSRLKDSVTRFLPHILFRLKKPTRAPDWRVKVFKISLRFHWDIHIEILKFGKKILYLITNVLKLDFGSSSNAIFPHIRRTLCWLTFPLKATRGHDKKCSDYVVGLRYSMYMSMTTRSLTQQCQLQIGTWLSSVSIISVI